MRRLSFLASEIELDKINNDAKKVIMDQDLEEILVPPEELMGDAMLSLNEKQRRFVCAALVFDCNIAQAYKFAGYESKNENTAYACASRLASRGDVQAAITEENKRRLNMQGSVIAVKRLVEQAKLGKVQAINSILDRTGYHVKTEQVVTVTDNRSAADILAEVRSLLSNNLPAKQLPPPIDAEYEDVSPHQQDMSEHDPNDLSDIL